MCKKIELTESQAKRVMALKEDYLAYNKDTFESFMWTLTYSPKMALEKMHLNDPMFLSYNIELRDIFIKYYNEKKEEKVYDKNIEYYPSVLVNALGNDVITLEVLYSRVKSFFNSESEHEIDRVNALFKSPEEQRRFGALMSIGFNYYEAEYFFEFIYAIEMLFDDLYYYTKNRTSIQLYNISNGTGNAEVKTSDIDEGECDIDILLSEKYAALIERKELIENFYELCDELDKRSLEPIDLLARRNDFESVIEILGISNP